ncbi:MAG TPA: sulfatase [Thermoanaerobaculia bacterium]
MTSSNPPRARRARAARWLCAAGLGGALLAAAAALAGCRGAGDAAAAPALPEGTNILLVTVDTLRADHLGSYGYARATSPHLDRLAAEGVRFEDPVVQWPKTGPSFASIFTATYPKDNGIVRRIGQPLPCRFRMLAEELQAAGYQTHAVIANAAVASDFYFDQGFDTYVEAWEVEQGDLDPIGAEAITRLATGLLEQIRGSEKPYFLWVHYVDPHAPYAPPEGEWRDRFQGDEHWDGAVRVPISTDRPKQQMLGIGTERVLDGRDELAFYVARYDAEIAYVDHWIGELFAAAGERGLLDRTLTAFTSDHGESLGEHGYYFDHGRFSFDTCLRVPLVLHYPGVLEPRVDDDGPVELLHLAPTLLEAAGVALADGAWMQGRSLWRRLRGEAAGAGDAAAAPPLAFAEAGWEAKGKWQKVVRDERFKLIFAQTRPEQQWIGGPGVRFTLFDLASDPGETVNVAERFPEDTERLTRELWAWDRAETFPVQVEPNAAACEGERSMTDDTAEVLKALGYL